MTLTEQWKKGELPEDAYYVTYYKNDTPEVDIYRRVYSLYDDSEVRFTIPQVDKVLAPVPSYDHFVELTEKVKENQQLKEMLYKCREKLDELDYGCEVWQGELTSFIEEIDNAIGEKK